MKYNKFGVPILTDKRIEEIAYNFLSQYDIRSLTTPCKAPISELLDYLRKVYAVKLVAKDIGTEGDRRIFARVIFSKNIIIFDEELLNNQEMESLYLFTAAHEIGHWVLHRSKKIIIPELAETIDQIDDYDKDFEPIYDAQEDFKQIIDDFIKGYLEFPKKKKLITPRDWLEHHANIFAASLLMPRKAFINALVKKQMEMGIKQHLGKIYLDRQPCNVNDYKSIGSYLKDIFGVSRKAIDIRLKQLGIFVKDTRRKYKPIMEP